MKLSFADCVFDSDAREVLRAGRPVALSPKAFALLELLIQVRPGAASKADIRARLWPGARVSDSSLTNIVAELRAALRDRRRKPLIIRTVSRYGYAFSAESKPARAGKAGEEAAGDACRLVWGRREIALAPGENLIGRDHEAVVWIDHDSVSRRHARIVVRAGGATVTDLDSKNGTYVRGERIREPTPLCDRDTLEIGPASMTFRVVRPAGSTVSAVKDRSRR